MDDTPTYSIGELAALAEVTPRTIRYYTAEGLLPVPEVRGKYAVYHEDHLNRLRLIARLKAAYLPLSVIKERLAALDAAQVCQMLAQPQPPAEASDSAAQYIANALVQRRALPPHQPAAALDVSEDEADPALAEVEELLAEADALAEGEDVTQPEAARVSRLKEPAALYDVGPALPAPAPEQPAPTLAHKRAAPAAPVPPAPGVPSAQAAQSLAPPAPAAPAPLEQAGPSPTPQTPHARSGLLGRLLPRRERAPLATGPADAPEPEHWSRVTLVPGVELHIREPAAPGLRGRIARLIAEARNILAD